MRRFLKKLSEFLLTVEDNKINEFVYEGIDE